MMRPQRLVLSRKRGFDLQEASRRLNGLPAQVVSRPSKWGNPFTIADMEARYGLDKEAARRKSIELFGQWMDGTLPQELSPGPPLDRAAIRAELGNRNLACWCSLDGPCHAEILLRIANAGLYDFSSPLA